MLLSGRSGGVAFGDCCYNELGGFGQWLRLRRRPLESGTVRKSFSIDTGVMLMTVRRMKTIGNAFRGGGGGGLTSCENQQLRRWMTD